jgi:hypothetical protein
MISLRTILKENYEILPTIVVVFQVGYGASSHDGGKQTNWDRKIWFGK